MKYAITIFLISSVTFFLGYKVGGRALVPQNEKTVETMKPSGEISAKFFEITEGEFKEYESLKTHKEKYLVANKILGKMLLVFLADLGLRLENKNLDFVKDSQNKIASEPEKSNEVAKGPQKIESQDDQQSGAASSVSSGSSQPKSLSREEILAKKQSGKPHPGATPEIPHGTVLEEGRLVGEKEIFDYTRRFERRLYRELIRIDKDELRNRFSEDFFWFQRVGDFRKRQKCKAIQKMQSELGLEITGMRSCNQNIRRVHQELWGESSF